MPFIDAIDDGPALTNSDWAKILEQESKVGNLDRIQSLITLWKSDNRSLRSFCRALSLAAKHHQTPTVRYLVDEGVPITALSLREAAAGGSSSCLDIFFQHGWDINKALQPTYPSVLAAAVGNESLVRWLLDRGADPNARCELDYTPLSCAVVSGSRAVVDLMFLYGGDTTKGELIYHAIERQPLDMRLLDMLLKKGAPLDSVLYSSSEQTELEQQFAALGPGTPLHAAVAAGNIEAVRYLIGKGASKEKTTTDGRTALQIASDTNACAEIVELLSGQ